MVTFWRAPKVINTPNGRGPKSDEARIRTLTIGSGIPMITTLPGASAAVDGIEKLRRRGVSVKPLQDYYTVGAVTARQSQVASGA